jgi:glycine cleavage system aminomethyltransferase T
VGEGAHELVYGGEAVLAGEAVVGRVRSAAYGYTVQHTIASAYLPQALARGTPLAIEALGRPVPAEISEDVLYDAENARVRS